MGRSPDMALTAVRFSLTATTMEDELNGVADALVDLRSWRWAGAVLVRGPADTESLPDG